MARTYDPRRARFFASICGLTFISEYHALRQMRVAWTRLSDYQRRKYLQQVAVFLQNDEQLLQKTYFLIDNGFRLKPEIPGHILAKQLKQRKYNRRWGRVNPVLQEIVFQLGPEERSRLVQEWQGARL